MMYSRRPALPPGRLTVREVCERAALSRSLFFASYRHNPVWAAILDLQVSAAGVLHASEGGVATLRKARAGEASERQTRRAANLGVYARRRAGATI